ncbi:MAG TPA: phage tail assembly protein [Stellaceae bacterium]|nr:phage tail assembly protein [Stellaceae bacterium]
MNSSSPITHQSDGSVWVSLFYPITVAGSEVRALKLHRPKVKQLRTLAGYESGIDRSVALISIVAGIPPSSVDELDGRDFNTLSGALADFLSGSPTGDAK